MIRAVVNVVSLVSGTLEPIQLAILELIVAIPDYQTVMLPLLTQLGDGREYRMDDVLPAICEQFKLTEEEQRELIPSGQMTVM